MSARLCTRLAMAVIAAIAIASPVHAQQPGDLVQQHKRSGPRFGVTWLGGSIADTVSARLEQDVAPVITQFGWQYERQFMALENGPVALNEWILLVGGLEQGLFLPSITWLVGLRTRGQYEVGIGPNLGAAGFALAISAGKTFRSGALALPVNIAVVPSRFGPRVSLLTGFNLYK